MRILLIEDDELLSAGLREALTQAGFAVDHLSLGRPALDALPHGMHDLAIVDLGLPDIDGLDLVRQIRRQGLRVPLLVLTARDGLADRVSGLNEGADDYLTKPFLLPELLARVHALIRRSQSVASPWLSVGALVLNLATREALLQDAPLLLTRREWDLLHSLMLAAPHVVPKRKLADTLSSWDKEITDNAVEIYVSRLRLKLQPAGVVLRTVRGVGYRLDAPT